MKFGKISAALVGVGLACSSLWGFEYDVRQPSDVLRPTWFAADTQPGVWTLNVEDAKAKARAAGAYTVVLNTGSWWCPYCETLEDMVLRSGAWRDYVAENGFYLGMYDFPYRGDVAEDQKWKSWHPELGRGWGFKCWLMCPEFLAEIGLTEAEGLQAVMAEYEAQKDLALPEATTQVISNWNGTATFEYGKVGYPTLIVYGPDGAERGRASFPWNNPADVTASEAQEYVIQAVEQLVTGKCAICDDPLSGKPDVSKAQVYVGWLRDEAGGIAGQIEVKTGRQSRKGLVKVSCTVTVGGRKNVLNPVQALGPDATCESCAETPAGLGAFTMTRRNTSLSAKLSLGANGLTGTFSDGTADYEISGGRDAFRTRDAESAARVSVCPKGVWSVVMKSADPVAASPFARGSGTLAVELKDKGKAKLSGVLGDGTKVNVSGQVIAGDNGVACLPVLANLYSRKGGFGFVIWFKNGRLLCFTDIAPWVSAGRDGGFTAKYAPSSTMSPGFGNVPGELELSLLDFPEDVKLGGLPLAVDPSLDFVTVSRRKWSGSDTTLFTATMTAKTGALKGSMTFFADNGGARPKRVKGAFSGIVMGGAGYGTVVVKGSGSWAVRVAVCGSCSE